MTIAIHRQLLDETWKTPNRIMQAKILDLPSKSVSDANALALNIAYSAIFRQPIFL
jgi:hypothetical protein